jgi:hypothetical protein
VGRDFILGGKTAVDEEAQGMEAAQRQIRALERQLRERPAPSPGEVQKCQKQHSSPLLF